MGISLRLGLRPTLLLTAVVLTASAIVNTQGVEHTQGLGSFSGAIPALLKKHTIPGASLAIMKDGRLVVAEGHGFADRETRVRVRPDTLFRIASVSKAVTGVGVLTLVQRGKIRLDDKAFAILDDLRPFPGATADPRLADITVRDLLRHSGGWITQEIDPQFLSLEIAGETGLPAPASAETIIRYWIGRSLQFTPGTQYSYANFGYNVLGRIIEKVTGQSYEDYMNSVVLTPLDIRRMQIGKTLKDQRADGEASYYDVPAAPLFDSVFPAMGKVPMAYGSWNHPALDAHGGWIASAVDLLRLVRGVEGSGGVTPVLSADMIRQMTAFQALQGQSASNYPGLGWRVNLPPLVTSEEWWHTGALQGCCAALLVRRADGVSYAVLFNLLPADYAGFFNELIPLMRDEVERVRRWPQRDLFPGYR
jgi:N-acyl-D-amino-acid deacylase